MEFRGVGSDAMVSRNGAGESDGKKWKEKSKVRKGYAWKRRRRGRGRKMEVEETGKVMQHDMERMSRQTVTSSFELACLNSVGKRGERRQTSGGGRQPMRSEEVTRTVLRRASIATRVGKRKRPHDSSFVERISATTSAVLPISSAVTC